MRWKPDRPLSEALMKKAGFVEETEIEPVNRGFDRLGDWRKFSQRMEEYLQGPISKYGGKRKFNDLLHYTGLRVMCWNLLKYSLRIWLGQGKRHDFEKLAHYAQMAWTRARAEGRQAPFFVEDEVQEREFIVPEGD
jgi:hypothetical protein